MSLVEKFVERIAGHNLVKVVFGKLWWFEQARDSVLGVFASPRMSKLFLILAVLVSLMVIGFGLVIIWAMLGLYFEIPNGWEGTLDVCRDSIGWNATSMAGTSVPIGEDGEFVTNFCNLNQWWFNTCVKAFVVLFSYINFLPVPWRLSCAHHVFCSHRANHDGVDFYGRDTDALWFNIPRSSRRRIAVGLNLAWVFHFVCLAMHIVWPEFVDGQIWPLILYHNLPLVLSFVLEALSLPPSPFFMLCLPSLIPHCALLVAKYQFSLLLLHISALLSHTALQHLSLLNAPNPIQPT